MKRISTESFKTCMKRVIRLKRVPMDRGSSKGVGSFGCGPRILRLLREVRAGCPQQVPIRTKRGTRPGSPLADGIFHVIMAHIMADVRHWITEQDDFMQLLPNS